MPCFKKLKRLIAKCDLFKTTEFLRYKEEPQYSTETGGCCSILIVIIFISVFMSVLLGTLTKSIIIWQYNIIQENAQPFNITASTKGDAKYMFAVGLKDMDMTSGERYFDLKLTQQIIINGTKKIVNIPLIPCQKEAWDNINQNVSLAFKRLELHKWLCPPLDYTFQISGKVTDIDYKYVKVKAMACDPKLDLTRSCASNETISKYLSENPYFVLNYYFINTLVNPSAPNQISFYLEDRNYVPFTLIYGGLLNIYISKYQVDTDESILPNSVQRSSIGGIVNFLGQLINTRVFNSEYATIYLRRSSSTLALTRNYKKLDDTLSYIGGLFGFIMIVMMFMRFYTEFSFQIEMGDKLYYYDHKDPLHSSQFNFISFLGYNIYNIISFFGYCKDWKIMKKYDICRQEIQKQFDINFLMKRIIFLQRSIRVLLNDHQFKALHMHEKLTLKQAESLRQYYRLRDKFNQQIANSKSAQNESNQINTTEQNLVPTIINQEIIQMSSPQISRSKSKRVSPIIDKNILKTFAIKQQKKKSKEQNNVEALSMDSIKNKPQIQLLQKQFKLLHKQSEQGNQISKKIFNGVNSNIFNKILKIMDPNHSKQQQQHSQQNQKRNTLTEELKKIIQPIKNLKPKQLQVCSNVKINDQNSSIQNQNQSMQRQLENFEYI